MTREILQTLNSDVLDNPVWAALSGPHARFAETNGHAARYRTDVAPFVALSSQIGEGTWLDLAELAGPDTVVTLARNGLTPPEHWEVVGRLDGVQLVGAGATGAADDPEAVVLTQADVPEMLDLVERTQPGPFLPRTVELGTYLGLRRDGALVAMAGERLRLPGWTEVSAVCTDAAYRGQGLANRLVRAVVAGILRRGETPFMHALASNTNAVRLYESLGFTLRQRMAFTALRVPADSGG